MNDAPVNLATGLDAPKPGEGWSRAKWLALLAFVFAAHVGLIFIFGQKKQIFPRAATNVPALKFTDDSGELFALNDPALFALPNPRDFAFAVWSRPPGLKQATFRFTESPRFLPSPDAENLGATFRQFMQTNYFVGYQLDFKPQPKLSEPVLPIEPALAQNSTMQIVGELAQRRLLDEINLPSLPYNDVIAPSKVQALVDAAGNVVSVVLLESSGLAAADQRALEIVRATRFAPAKNLTVGQMIFNWRTIPMTTTNDNPNAN